MFNNFKIGPVNNKYNFLLLYNIKHVPLHVTSTPNWINEMAPVSLSREPKKKRAKLFRWLLHSNTDRPLSTPNLTPLSLSLSLQQWLLHKPEPFVDAEPKLQNPYLNLL